MIKKLLLEPERGEMKAPPRQFHNSKKDRHREATIFFDGEECFTPEFFSIPVTV